MTARQSSKKPFFTVLTAAAVMLASMILFCTGCIKKSETAGKMVFWTVQLADFDKYINAVITGYNERHKENNAVKWVDVPYSEAEKRILAAILTDNPPDLANLTPDMTKLLASKNALYAIPDEMLRNFNLAGMLEYNGKYFGLPFYASSAVLLFNKSLMPDLIKMPETYDELLKIKPPEGVYTAVIPLSENDTLLKILNKYGINSAETINSKKSAELFRLIKYAYDNKIIPKESAVYTHREALEQYMSGRTAFIITGVNFINMIKENAPDVYKNTAVLPQLTGSERVYDFSLMNFVIPLKAKNKTKALEFAMYMLNAENQLKFSKLAAILPVNKQTLEDDFFNEAASGDLTAQGRIISAGQLKNSKSSKAYSGSKNINVLSANAVQNILINDKDIQKTLDDFSEEWRRLE